MESVYFNSRVELRAAGIKRFHDRKAITSYCDHQRVPISRSWRNLIDEATGYQEVRDKQALQAILDAYLRKELAAWARRFPDEFYREIFRLRGWDWKGRKFNPPSVVGHYTNDLVYERLAPGILEELQRRNPKNDKGNRKAKHQQFLTDDIGHPALSQHIHALMAFMRVSANWEQFYDIASRAFPKKNTNLLLPLTEPIVIQ